MSFTKWKYKCRSQLYGKTSYSSCKWVFSTPAGCPYVKFKSLEEIPTRTWKGKKDWGCRPRFGSQKCKVVNARKRDGLTCNSVPCRKMKVLLKDGILCRETPTFKGHTEQSRPERKLAMRSQRVWMTPVWWDVIYLVGGSSKRGCSECSGMRSTRKGLSLCGDESTTYRCLPRQLRRAHWFVFYFEDEMQQDREEMLVFCGQELQ